MAESARGGTARIVGVSKRYTRRLHGEVVAASGVDLDIGPDETLGIIGPNGAGKTTLLRLIAGITAPDAGRIERTGRTLALIELGAGLHPDLTGAENIGFAGSLAGMSRRQIIERRGEIVEFSGLGDDIHRPIKHYSNGMLARLAFSVAAHADPDLLLVDEVLAVGDQDFQRSCLLKMDELRSEGCTIVIVTHDLATVTSVCDRALLIEHGTVAASGSPVEVVYRYLGFDPRLHGDQQLELRVENPSVPPGGRLELEVRSLTPRRYWDARATIDVMLPLHPAASFEARHSGPLPMGSAAIDRDWSDLSRRNVHIDLDTTGLPPGRYLVQLTLSAAGTPDSTSNLVDCRVEGATQERIEIPLRARFAMETISPEHSMHEPVSPMPTQGSDR